MNFKGTPGPWIVDEESFQVTGRAGDFVADFDYGRWKEDHANADLIAAAPELLESLRQLRDYVQDMYGDSYEDCLPDHPMMRAKSVIEKALGQ